MQELGSLGDPKGIARTHPLLFVTLLSAENRSDPLPMALREPQQYRPEEGSWPRPLRFLSLSGGKFLSHMIFW